MKNTTVESINHLKIAVICHDDVYTRQLSAQFNWTFICSEKQFWTTDFQPFHLVYMELMCNWESKPQERTFDREKIEAIRHQTLAPITLLSLFQHDDFPPKILLQTSGVKYHSLRRLTNLPQLIEMNYHTHPFYSKNMVAIEELQLLYQEMDTGIGHHSLFSALDDFCFSIRVVHQPDQGLSLFRRTVVPKLHKFKRSLEQLRPNLPQSTNTSTDAIYGHKTLSLINACQRILQQSEAMIASREYAKLGRLVHCILKHLEPASSTTRLIKKYALITVRR